MKVGAQIPALQEANAPLLQYLDLVGEGEQYLTHCPGQNTKIHVQVLTALLGLIDRAKTAGFDLRVASGFRSFERQLLIWNDKANGIRPVLDGGGQPIDLSVLSDDEKVFAILRWSALPGASRHHWGTDIDVYDRSRISADYQVQLTIEETEGNGPFAEFHRWLSTALSEHPQDFYRPYVDGIGGVSPEPWHLSYAPLAHHLATQLTENVLREKIQATDIALKDSVLKNLNNIFNRYIKPYQ